IAFIPSAGSSQLYVSDSVIEGNGTSVQGGSGGGIVIKPSGSASVRASIDRVRVDSNIYGIFANGTGTTGVIAVQVHDSVVSGNSFGGISAYTAAGKGITSITIDRTSSTLNGAAGVLAQGAPAFAILSQSVVIGNGTGLSAVDGGHILSYQDNKLTGNVVDGAAPPAVSTRELRRDAGPSPRRTA